MWWNSPVDALGQTLPWLKYSWYLGNSSMCGRRGMASFLLKCFGYLEADRTHPLPTFDPAAQHLRLAMRVVGLLTVETKPFIGFVFFDAMHAVSNEMSALSFFGIISQQVRREGVVGGNHGGI